MADRNNGIYGLPKSSRDGMTPLQALSICHINLNNTCDHHHEQLKLNYLASWRNPGPSSCNDDQAPPEIREVRYNRLGMDTETICTRPLTFAPQFDDREYV